MARVRVLKSAAGRIVNGKFVTGTAKPKRKKRTAKKRVAKRKTKRKKSTAKRKRNPKRTPMDKAYAMTKYNFPGLTREKFERDVLAAHRSGETLKQTTIRLARQAMGKGKRR